MEHNRIAAQARSAPVESVDNTQWWKDASQVKYQIAGEIDIRNLEGRLLRAVAARGAGQGFKLRNRTTATILAELSSAADQAYNRNDPTSSYGPKFTQLPQDQSDFDEAMRWFTDLNPPHLWPKSRGAWTLNRAQRVLNFRAMRVPWSFDTIGQDIGVSGERARQIYKQAIGKALKIANGPKVKSAEIEKLQERNRAHRREMQDG